MALVMFSGSLFQSVRASGKNECLYREVLVHGIATELVFTVLLSYGTLLAAIGASGNSVSF